MPSRPTWFWTSFFCSILVNTALLTSSACWMYGNSKVYIPGYGRAASDSPIFLDVPPPPESVPVSAPIPDTILGEADGRGEAADRSPGDEPMEARLGSQAQALMSRDPEGPGKIGEEPAASQQIPGENGDGSQQANPGAPAMFGAAAQPEAQADAQTTPSFKPAIERLTQNEPPVNRPSGPVSPRDADTKVAAGETSMPEKSKVRSSRPKTSQKETSGTETPSARKSPAETSRAVTSPSETSHPEPSSTDASPARATAKVDEPKVTDDRENALAKATATPPTQSITATSTAAEDESAQQKPPLAEDSIASIVDVPPLASALVSPGRAQPRQQASRQAPPQPQGAAAIGGKPGPAAPAADPAPQTDSESDPFSNKGAVKFKRGSTDVQLGRKHKIIRPRLGLGAQTAMLNLPQPITLMLGLTLDETGNVISVRVVKSSGSKDIDQACKVAAYQWWLEPTKDKNGKPVKDVVPFVIGFS